MAGQISADRHVEQYRHRHPIWWNTLILCLIAIFVLGIIYLLKDPEPGWLAVVAVAVAVIVIAVARAAFISSRGSWESWIEGGVFFWHLPGKGESRIQLEKINEILEVVFPNEDRAKEYELILIDGRRVAIDSRLIQFKEFRGAVLRERPGLVWGSRNGKLCYVCGEDLRVRKDRCACGALIPDKTKLLQPA